MAPLCDVMQKPLHNIDLPVAMTEPEIAQHET